MPVYGEHPRQAEAVQDAKLVQSVKLRLLVVEFLEDRPCRLAVFRRYRCDMDYRTRTHVLAETNCGRVA